MLWYVIVQAVWLYNLRAKLVDILASEVTTIWRYTNVYIIIIIIIKYILSISLTFVNI